MSSLSEPDSHAPAHAGAPWVVVSNSHDMARALRQTDMTIDSSPWRFVFQIRGIKGLPVGISHVVVAWKTKFAQAQARVAVGSSSLPFERNCITVDTSFAVDPLLNEGEIRDKMLIFSIKGFRSNDSGDESAIRLGSFSFRCLAAMSATTVGHPSRVFKIAVDSAGLPLDCAVVVSLSVICFPLWMSPAFGSEFDRIASGGDTGNDALLNFLLKDTLAELSRLSQDYIAARSLLSSGCANGSIALLDPIFCSSVNMAGRELLFPAPPFPRCVVDSSFSAVMAPAILLESIGVAIWKYHKLARCMHLNCLRKMKARASSLIHRLSDDSALTVMQMVLNAWSKVREQRQRIAREQRQCSARCAFIWNRILQRYKSIGQHAPYLYPL